MSSDRAWMDDAACAGYVELYGEQVVDGWFFPERGESTTTARSICGTCPVQAHCAEYALTGEGMWREHGIWGGLSARQRRAIRVEREIERLPMAERPINHGTEGGYRAHLRRGETACPECKAANVRATSERKKAAA